MDRQVKGILGEKLGMTQVWDNGKVVPVMPKPRGPFQGWRYFPAKEAPPDLAKSGVGLAELPENLRRELRELGLL